MIMITTQIWSVKLSWNRTTNSCQLNSCQDTTSYFVGTALSRPSMASIYPETRRRKFDSNFNAVPEPFKSYGSTIEFSFKSGGNDTSYMQSSSRNIDQTTSSITANYSSSIMSPTSLPSYTSSPYKTALNSTAAAPSKLLSHYCFVYKI